MRPWTTSMILVMIMVNMGTMINVSDFKHNCDYDVSPLTESVTVKEADRDGKKWD